MDIEKLFASFPSMDELIDIIRHTSTTVWENELVGKDIESWLSNFRGEIFDVKHERLLALWLLSHFTFYNQREVQHLCKVIYRDLIHRIVRNHDVRNVNTKVIIKDFFQHSNIISHEKTGGSGSFIAYFFRHENHLPMTLFNFSLMNVNENIKNIIVIDDVTLSEGEAGQMYDFWQMARNKFSDKKFFLLTLMASENSINYLTSKFGIEIITAIRLDNRDKCFNEESDIFSTFIDADVRCELVTLAKKFSEHYGEKIKIPGIGPLGYDDGQFTFGFFYNTPDNTLPIFWGQINGWIPILKRYHKNYKTQTYFHDERFI